MNNTKKAGIIMAIIIMAFSLVIFWIIYKRIEITNVSETPKKIEADEGRPIYAIPENIVPTEREIEERIAKNKENRLIQEKAAVKPAEEKAAIIAAAGSVEKPKAAERVIIPAKKEVRFPTYEVRKTSESRGGPIAY